MMWFLIKFPFILLIVQIISFRCFAGGDLSGGGNCLVLKDGTVKFFDINQTPASEINSTEQNEYIWKNDRYINHVGIKDEKFFDPAYKVLDENLSEFPIFEKLKFYLKNTNVLLTESRIPMAVFTSKSSPQGKTETCAIYHKNSLIVSQRLSNQLDSDGSLALRIHEALRILNRYRLIDVPLTTEEIEILTRHLMGKKFIRPGDDMTSIYRKLKNNQIEPEECMNRTITKATNEMDEIIKRLIKLKTQNLPRDKKERQEYELIIRKGELMQKIISAKSDFANKYVMPVWNESGSGFWLTSYGKKISVEKGYFLDVLTGRLVDNYKNPVISLPFGNDEYPPQYHKILFRD